MKWCKWDNSPWGVELWLIILHIFPAKQKTVIVSFWGITVLSIHFHRLLMRSQLCSGLLNEAGTKLSKRTAHWHPPHVEWRNIQAGPNGSGSEFGCRPFFLWYFFSCIHPSIHPLFSDCLTPRCALCSGQSLWVRPAWDKHTESTRVWWVLLQGLSSL